MQTAFERADVLPSPHAAANGGNGKRPCRGKPLLVAGIAMTFWQVPILDGGIGEPGGRTESKSHQYGCQILTRWK